MILRVCADVYSRVDAKREVPFTCRKVKKIELTPREALALKRKVSAGRRAGIILLAAKLGRSPNVPQIGEETRCGPQMVRKWLTRWVNRAHGVDLDKLLDGHIHTGRRPNDQITEAKIRQIASIQPPGGTRHWTARTVALRLGIDPRSSEIYTVRWLWTRVRTNNPNIFMRPYSSKHGA